MNDQLTDQTRDLLAALVEALDVPYGGYVDRQAEVLAVREAAAHATAALEGVLDGISAEIAEQVLRRHTAKPVVAS